MGLKITKRIKLFSGVHLNVSKTGMSLSLGQKGANLNLSKKGATANVGLPGSGISYRKKIELESLKDLRAQSKD